MATSILQKMEAVPELSTYEFVKDNQTVDGNSYGSFYFDTHRTGYTILGIIGVYLRNATTDGTRVTYCSIIDWYETGGSSGNNIRVRVRNLAANAAKIKITLQILYQRI